MVTLLHGPSAAAGICGCALPRDRARQKIYLDDEDRRRYLSLLGKEVTQQGWRCYAYCLMDNHYHLLIETPEPNLVAGRRRRTELSQQPKEA